MDVSNMTLVGLATLGFVNSLTFFEFGRKMDSKTKFACSIAFAFALTFIPAELGNIILEKAKLAVETAFTASGVYKLATKAGGA